MDMAGSELFREGSISYGAYPASLHGAGSFLRKQESIFLAICHLECNERSIFISFSPPFNLEFLVVQLSSLFINLVLV